MKELARAARRLVLDFLGDFLFLLFAAAGFRFAAFRFFDVLRGVLYPPQPRPLCFAPPLGRLTAPVRTGRCVGGKGGKLASFEIGA